MRKIQREKRENITLISKFFWAKLIQLGLCLPTASEKSSTFSKAWQEDIANCQGFGDFPGLLLPPDSSSPTTQMEYLLCAG